jgi:mannose-6-phosphate isomerase-like protein (cupin superfamily)
MDNDFYIANIEEETLKNENFRKVLFTGPKSQLVVMTIQPGDDIGAEIHEDHDQFIRIESGIALVIIDGIEKRVEDDWAIVIPAGAEHNIVNRSETEVLKLYTIYSPPEHKDGTIHDTKEAADQE